MKITLGELKMYNACTDRYKHLCECLKKAGKEIKDDTEVSILEILDCNGVKDAFWALRTQKYEDYCLILADVAESVLHIYENKYPTDERPRLAIQGIRDYKAGLISIKELIKLAAAAYAAADAANAVYDAAAAAADAANAYAAADAAADAADAVYDAAATANANNDDAAYAAQWKKNEEILRKHLSQ